MRKIVLFNVLNLICEDWNKLPSCFKPWGVWICYFAPLEQLGSKKCPSRLLETWFLSNKGLHVHNVNEYIRFYFVHYIQPWCLKSFLKEPISFLKEPNIMGIIEFAEIPSLDGFERIYFSRSWGRNLSMTLILKANSEGELETEKILEV